MLEDAFNPTVPSGCYVLPEAAHFRLEAAQKTVALMAELCGNSRTANGTPVPVDGERLQAVLDAVSDDLKTAIGQCQWQHKVVSP